MGGKSSAPAPDPRIGEASNRQVALNERMYDDYNANDRPWMREVTNRALGISEANAKRAGELSDYQLGQMKYYDDRFKTVVAPMEDQLAKDVNRFDSAGYKNQLIDTARADTEGAFDRSMAATSRGLARMGVNPASGRFASTMNEGSLARASALANAANKTRIAADQIGLANKMQLYGGMKGMSGLGMTNASLATGAIGAGNQSGAGMTGAAGAYLNANNAAMAGYNSGMNGALGSWNNYSSLGIQAANANAQNDPFNTILGAAAGVGTRWALGKVG